MDVELFNATLVIKVMIGFLGYMEMFLGVFGSFREFWEFLVTRTGVHIFQYGE